jgi:hypothetical protein
MNRRIACRARFKLNERLICMNKQVNFADDLGLAFDS